MGRKRRIITCSEQETFVFGESLVLTYPQGAIFCLQGDLGAGKTTLVKGIVYAASKTAPQEVTSPTFCYLNIYDNVYHFDLYRLRGVEDFQALGLESYLYEKGYICIEWYERIAPLLPQSKIVITIKALDEQCREILCD